MNYKEKLDTLYVTSKVDIKKIKKVEKIDYLFDDISSHSVKELSDFVRRFMNKYNIGGKISKKFWGVRGYKRIQQSLYDNLKQQLTREKPASTMQLYDDLNKDVKNKNVSKYDISRVARTEGKSVAIVIKLEKMKEAGLKYVRYKTRGDSKVRDSHKVLNGREYEIDFLLSPQGEDTRIPAKDGINCRCTYEMSMRGV